MNICLPSKKRAAFSLTELVIVLGVSVAIAWLLLWPHSHGCKARPERINCVNNLKQVGVAFNSWAAEHNGYFPMQVSFTNGGTSEAVERAPAFVHYRSLSNEL